MIDLSTLKHNVCPMTHDALDTHSEKLRSVLPLCVVASLRMNYCASRDAAAGESIVRRAVAKAHQ